MNSRPAFTAPFVCALFVAALLPAPAAAAPVLSVSPTALSVQGTVGTNIASKTVQVSKSGNRRLRWTVSAPTASCLTVSPTSGTNAGTLTVSFRTSTLAAGTYSASFAVQDGTSVVRVTVSATMVWAARLTIACPANKTVASLGGSAVPVSYSATTSGGVAPVTVTGTPASGSSFPVGTTAVSVTAKSSDNQTASCGFSVTVTFTAVAPTTAYGPQSSIMCPADAIDILPGQTIQSFVDYYPGNTTFCLRAGVHPISSAITPRSGDKFIGEYGAILDGSGWVTTDANQGAFRAHNQDIDDVTIRNLVIRKMPQRGVHALYWMSDRWTIEYNELTANQTALSVPNNSLIRNNYIHHNTGGAYLVWKAANTTFDTNDISYNGGMQKVLGSSYVTFRNNFVHHNVSDGIWFDTENVNALVEGNRVEDNGREGIALEISGRAIVRNNVVRRSRSSAIFIGTSKDIEIYGNTLEDNFRGIQYFLNCAAVGGGTLLFDLANNYAHDNIVRVGTTSGALASGLGYISSCTATQVAPYLSGAKNLKFDRNQYTVPSNSKYWMWGLSTFKYWSEWISLPQDSTGTIVY
jgi:parallel beta-helix repeat protein